MLSATGLRGALAALAAALAATLLVATPVAAAPGACDADGDGLASGVVESLASDGADEAAAALAADTGVVLATPAPAHLWRVAVCVEPGPEGTQRRSVLGAPTQELAPEAPTWEAQARERAVDDITPRLWRPGPRTSPPVQGVQFVGLEMWLAVDPDAWVPVSGTARAGEVSVSLTASPQAMVWELSDGVTRICPGPGVQYSPGAPGPVGEVQTYLSDGSRPAPPVSPELAEPASSRPIDDRRCSLSSPLDCSASDVADVLREVLALPADVVAGLAGPLKAVWDFIQGCAGVVTSVASSVLELAGQLGELVDDPEAFMADKFALAQGLHDAVSADPGGFAGEFLGEAFELDMLNDEDQRARWVGMVACEMAVAILTGGAASPRVAKLLADDTFLERLADWRPNRGDDDSDERSACQSSFPTGTLVATADGAAVPIEDLRAGDRVLAFDLTTATWAPRAVAAQWSYLDTDEMATLVLADGSTVSATDHHRFYDAGEGAYVEAEDLDPGDVLVTPKGRVSVAEVTLWPSGPTLVWELSVDVDHSFAVLAGDHALAVHNQECRVGGGDLGASVPGDEFLPGLPPDAPKPLGLGSTGRTRPANLTEQLAMTEVRTTPGGVILFRMTDSRWPGADGWVKVAHNVNGVEIHYVRNTRTGAVDDFKFAGPS